MDKLVGKNPWKLLYWSEPAAQPATTTNPSPIVKEKHCMEWKKGRGKLGVLEPLLGDWIARADSDLGPVVCTRRFSKILGGKYIELRTTWELTDRTYEELALFGVAEDKNVHVWSFTSDGKHSQGQIAEARDLQAQALSFELQMPAGLARQAYWPHPEEGFVWVVESHSKKGWNRFVEHHYTRLPS
jgi:hypothetical protein